MFTVVSKETVDGLDKYRIEHMETKKTVYALHCGGSADPIIYDEEDEMLCGDYNWKINAGGYAIARVNGQMTYMHRLIMTTTASHSTVDHINWIKTDNRRKNLRAANMSQQNSNRGSRCDKLQPLPELIEVGVTEYPRHIRWDRTEKKFIIDKHPMLIKHVEQGIRKKAMISGTKSATMNVIQKYQDILAKLDELNQEYSGFADTEFQEIKNENLNEFKEICKAIDIYNGTYVEVNDTQPTYIEIVPQRRVEKGRKKPSALPEGCGVTISMVPKYVWYRPECEKRGDMFIIERHPKLVVPSWKTTSSKKYTTLQKYEMLMAYYNDLENKN